MRKALLALVVAGSGCGTTVDTSDPSLPSISGYTAWESVVTTNEIPGHGDTYRIHYYNERATRFLHAGRYPIGSVIVKEIHKKDANGGEGDLDSIVIMRKVGDESGVSAPVNGGWVFSEKSSADGDETAKDSCYMTCHRNAPYDAAWLDYGH